MQESRLKTRTKKQQPPSLFQAKLVEAQICFKRPGRVERYLGSPGVVESITAAPLVIEEISTTNLNKTAWGSVPIAHKPSVSKKEKGSAACFKLFECFELAQKNQSMVENRSHRDGMKLSFSFKLRPNCV